MRKVRKRSKAEIEMARDRERGKDRCDGEYVSIY